MYIINYNVFVESFRIKLNNFSVRSVFNLDTCLSKRVLSDNSLQSKSRKTISHNEEELIAKL